MLTWEDYKSHVKSTDSEASNDIKEMEAVAEIVGAIIEQRNALGITQRELAAMCGIPQSSIARIEAHTVAPKLETVLKLMQPLGLKLVVSPKE